MPVEFSIVIFVLLACLALWMTYLFFFSSGATLELGNMSVFLIVMIVVFAAMTVVGNSIDNDEAKQFIQQHMVTQ